VVNLTKVSDFSIHDLTIENTPSPWQHYYRDILPNEANERTPRQLKGIVMAVVRRDMYLLLQEQQPR